MPTLDPDALRRFSERDWQAPERLARVDRATAPVADKVRLAIDLYEACRRTRPDWPTDADRRQDLASHLRLKDLLARSAHVFPR